MLEKRIFKGGSKDVYHIQVGVTAYINVWQTIDKADSLPAAESKIYTLRAEKGYTKEYSILNT